MSNSPPFVQSVAQCGARIGHTETSEVLREMNERRTQAAVTRENSPPYWSRTWPQRPVVFAALIVQRVGE
jgi:hypothetical protein